jgi:hypothetical protein
MTVSDFLQCINFGKEDNMKILKTVMLVVVLLLVPAYAFSANLGYMRISLIEGDVQIMTPDAEDWGPASVNIPLAEGDQIWVPQGARAELHLNSGTYIRLDESSALQILSMDKDSSQFYLSQGYAYINYNAPRRSVIQVDTPDASTRAFSKAIFRIDMSEQYSDVAVYKGYVETENQVGTTRIKAGQMVSLGQNTYGELAPMGPPDEWENWNKMRNDMLSARKGRSSSYLPSELNTYSYDFDNYGRWVSVPDYGYVWTPTIVVGVSWSPYRDGRWIWRGGDYVWVGYEPWGWAPYHYGRWSFAVNIGWFWVPPVTRQVYWSPGYVGWVRTADYVAWVPLAPGETYYGRGNYGRNSVNITNININQVNITNVYKNVNVNNGVTIVNRNTFATSSPQVVNVDQGTVRQKIFTRNNISVGTPAIKPTRESYFATPKTISPAKLPPQSVKDIQPKQLKKSRPFIRDAEKSVLNPGIKPKDLPVNTVTTPRTPRKGTPRIQQVKPGERLKPRGTEVSPTKTREQQVKPEEKKAVAPERGPTGRVKPSKEQIRPEERVKPRGTEVSPRETRKQQVKPEEKKTVAPESRPIGRGKPSKEQVEPEERVKPSAPESGPAVRRGEKQKVKPEERVKPSGPVVSPTDKGERQQIKPVEKKAVVPEGGPTGRGEKQRVKPEERVKPSGPVVSPTDKGEKQQIKPEKKKAVVPEGGPTGRGEKQRVKPDKKGKPGEPECGPGEKDEKNPEKCPQKD